MNGRLAYATLGVALLQCACGSELTEPEVLSIQPNSAWASQLPLQVTVRGSRLRDGVHVSLDDQAMAGRRGLEANVGGEHMTDVKVTDATTFTGYVPASLPVGAHDVEVRLSDGRRGVLPRGFTVLGVGTESTSDGETSAPDVTPCNAGEFGTPELVWPASLTSDRAPTLTADRLTIMFSRITATGEDIMLATRSSVDAAFGEPVAIPEFSGGSDAMPVLSADQLHIYFASKRSGSWDLWVGDRAAVGISFGNVHSLTALNTPSSELRPWLSADELTLYFESDRAAASGVDVWRATRPGVDAEFAAPEPVPGLNGPGAQGSGSLTPNSLTCYYVADSAQVLGWHALQRTQRVAAPDPFAPGTPVTSLSGFNIDGYASLSPDGRELVFGATGQAQIQVWHALVNCTQ